MRVQEWTDVAESDEAPKETITAKGKHPRGLIKTLVGSGFQASASGGWVAQDLHKDSAPEMISRLARAAVVENLYVVVDALFLGQTDKIDMSDSKVRVAAEIVKKAVAFVGIDKGRNLFWEHAVDFSKGFICDNKAKRGAGGPTKKAKTPTSKRRPHHNPKGQG